MIVDSGKLLFLQQLNGSEPIEDIDFCLYTNAVTWEHDTDIADITEAAWTAYARARILSWELPTLNVFFQSVSLPTVTPIDFANGEATAQTAIGWFAVGHTSGVLLGGDPFSLPAAIDPGGSRNFAPSKILDTI